jgi:hypothetical protein
MYTNRYDIHKRNETTAVDFFNYSIPFRKNWYQERTKKHGTEFEYKTNAEIEKLDTDMNARILQGDYMGFEIQLIERKPNDIL